MKLTKAQIEGLLTIIGEGHVAHINTPVSGLTMAVGSVAVPVGQVKCATENGFSGTMWIYQEG